MSNKVGSIGISIKGKAKHFIAAMRKTRKPTRALKRDIQRTGTATTQMSRQSVKGIQSMGRAFKRTNRSATGLLRTVMSSGWTKLAGLAGGAGLTYGAYKLTKTAIQQAAAWERSEISFTAMLKSSTRAKTLLKELERFSAETPFQMENLTAAAKSLMAYGFAAKQIIPNLRMLGDVSSALDIPMKDLTYLYGTTKTEGRLMGKDLRQFLMRGIPLTGQLAKQFGVAESEIRGMVSAGKVGFGEVQRALISMTSGAGQYAGITEDLSRSLVGRWSTMKDNILLTFKDLGLQLAEKMNLKGMMGRVIDVFRDSRAEIVALAMSAYQPLIDIGEMALPLLLGTVSDIAAGFAEWSLKIEQAGKEIKDLLSGTTLKQLAETMGIVLGTIPTNALGQGKKGISSAGASIGGIVKSVIGKHPLLNALVSGAGAAKAGLNAMVPKTLEPMRLKGGFGKQMASATGETGADMLGKAVTPEQIKSRWADAAESIGEKWGDVGRAIGGIIKKLERPPRKAWWLREAQALGKRIMDWSRRTAIELADLMGGQKKELADTGAGIAQAVNPQSPVIEYGSAAAGRLAMRAGGQFSGDRGPILTQLLAQQRIAADQLKQLQAINKKTGAVKIARIP